MATDSEYPGTGDPGRVSRGPRSSGRGPADRPSADAERPAEADPLSSPRSHPPVAASISAQTPPARKTTSATSATSKSGPQRGNRMVRFGALALVLILAIAGGLVWRSGKSGSNSAGSCDTRTPVTLAVPDPLHDFVFAQARAAEAAGVCAMYTIEDQPAGQVAADIKSGGNAVPDVWIPDSPIWVDDVSSRLGRGWATQGGTIATSPVAFAVPKSLQGRPALAAAGDWRTIFASKLPITVGDPTTASATIAATATAQELTTDKTQRTALLQRVISLSRSTETEDSLLDKATKGADVARIFPTSEQQITSFNKQHAGQRLTTLVPRQGVPQLRYDWVVPVKPDGPDPGVLSALYSRLTSSTAQQTLAKAGFRGASGAPSPSAVVPASATLLAPPTSGKAAAAVRSYQDLAKDARMLVMVDVSGSMTTPIAPGQSRVALLKQFTIVALDVLPQSTKIGAWAFSTNLVGKQPWKDVSGGIDSIERTPVGNAHRAKLVAAAKSLPALVAKNGDTGLYDSAWAAYQRVSAGYDPRYVNSVVILTDGANDNPAGGLSLSQLTAKLRKAYNPAKPVKIVAIGIGNQTDKAALAQLASATNGLSYQALTPTAVTNVFIDAYLKRG